MKADTTSKPTTVVPPALPHDLLAEGARARKLSADVEGVKSLVEGTRLVNDVVLGQVLFALWDSGFYEFSLTHPRFQIHEAADKLRLDATLLQWLLEYLVGRGIIESADGQMGLTEHGTRLSNVLLRGTMNLYIGGWGPLLPKIGPLLRMELNQSDFKNLRSGRHTVMGTEQLICVRTVPAVLKVLAGNGLRGVVDLACRTGEFLIQLARSEPALHGMGVDKAADRIASAEVKADAYNLTSRLRFVTAEFGRDPVPLDDEWLSKVDVITALYMLHEAGRDGRQKIVRLLREIKTMFSGRAFLFMETLPYSKPPVGARPTTTFSQLDYLLVHRLKGQAMPLPSSEWRSLVVEAGLKLIGYEEVYGSGLYLAEL